MKTTLFSGSVGDIKVNMAFINNLSATTNPGVTDDSASGYSVGSIWVNTSASTAYICSDPTIGAAVWNLMGEGGISPTELALLDGALAGTVVASKAVAVDSNKDVADFRNLSGTNLKAGKDAVAGSLTVFPATTARGSTTITASANTGATTTNINTAAQAGARTYTVPDAGGSASFVMTAGTQEIAGAKTFTSAINAGKDAVSGSLVLFPATTARGTTTVVTQDNAGATNTTISVDSQAAGRTYHVPDAGADATVVMSEGAQTVNGVKTFGSPPVMSGASITSATIPNAALAANGGLAALIGAGLGASHSYLKTQSGAATLLASAAGDRSVIIVVVVDQTFANGDGAQPTFQIGQTGTANKFADTTAFTGATAGTVKTFAGTLTGTDNLIVTGVAGTGTTETGGITVTVLALSV